MSIGQGQCAAEGNRRSGVALGMRHRICGISTYGLSGLRKEDEHPTYTLFQGVWRPLPFSPLTGMPNADGQEKLQFSTDILLYLENDTRRGNSVDDLFTLTSLIHSTSTRGHIYQLFLHCNRVDLHK